MISIIMIPAPFEMIAPALRQHRQFDAGDMIFHAGDPVDGLAVVLEGEVELSTSDRHGRQLTIYTAGPGEPFTEPCLFERDFQCSGRAAIETTIALFPQRVITDQMRKDPDFAIALYERLADQLQMGRQRLEVLSIPRAEDRVLAGLSIFRQTGTVMAFANTVGLSHEATYRALSQLTRQGKVQKTGRGQYAPV